MKRNKTIYQKVASPIKSINWKMLGITFSIVAALSLYMWGIVLISTDSSSQEAEQIEQIRVGMSKAEVFTHLEDKGWSEYDEDGYHYAWNFRSPSGDRKTFWVTINYNNVVTDIATY